MAKSLGSKYHSTIQGQAILTLLHVSGKLPCRLCLRPVQQMGPGQQQKPARKRTRKRKRRVVSDSSSSSEEDSSSSSDTSVGPSKTTKPAPPEDTDTDESEDDVSSSSDESQGVLDQGLEGVDMSLPSGRPERSEPPLQRDSPSPQPPVDIPPFIPQNTPESEQVLKEKFRKFWMASIAEGFKEDLEEIRKVCVPPPEVHCCVLLNETRWTGTEPWPVTASTSHRVACFRCGCVLFEFYRRLCERDGSRVGSAFIVLFIKLVASALNIESKCRMGNQHLTGSAFLLLRHQSFR